jgi:hypothetical protein
VTQHVSAPSNALKTLECSSRDGVHLKWQKEKLADKTVYPYGSTGINFGLRQFLLESTLIGCREIFFSQSYTVQSSVPFLFSLQHSTISA